MEEDSSNNNLIKRLNRIKIIYILSLIGPLEFFILIKIFFITDFIYNPFLPNPIPVIIQPIIVILLLLSLFSIFFLMPYVYGFYLVNLKKYKEIIIKIRNKFNVTLYKVISIYAIPSFVINLLWTEYFFTSQSPPFDFNLPYIIFFIIWTIIFMLIYFGGIKIEDILSSQESSSIHDVIEPTLSTLDLEKPRIFERVRLDIGFTTPSKPLICPVCSHQNSNNSRVCKSCFYKFPSCIICNRTIGGEELVFCPYCDSPYHKIEFFEWLKIKATCPSCNKELDLWEFQKFLKEHDKIKENSLNLCPNCKKLIPNDSIYCIFCGIPIKRPL